MTPSPRNKTIATDLAAGTAYLDRCLRLSEALPLSRLLDKTVLGDAFAVLPLLPRECVDLLIADPPYNLRKDYGGAVFSPRDDAAYADYTRRWLDLAAPLLKPGASVYVCCDWRSSLVIGQVLQEFFTLRNRITWQRDKGRGAARNWKNGMEDIWFATLGGDYTFHADAVKLRRQVLAPYRENGQPKDWQERGGARYRDSCASNFWDDVTIPFWSMAENTGHPAQKPEKLLAKLLLASSDPGDLVLDPFLGSGSTSVAAKKLGRHYLGVEQNPQYCVWAEQRLEQAEQEPRIQGYADGVFWPRNAGPR